ncbi:hypothetical protein D9V30_00090 [Mycetocola reblochoni]|uniref:Uncharacterized protein n=1 Tax=Mycetocola reblochoni TaxID=331618 RepID=A0A3L6ZSE6_9MICO|nr:hypothetical protein [Mycetocola reblochoni]RLP70873.1 hypothetical protein D9V30_00090 [Mycetocola reblochoni]
MSQAIKQVRVVAATAAVQGQDFEPVAFFEADGKPVDVGGAAAVAALEARVKALEDAAAG